MDSVRSVLRGLKLNEKEIKLYLGLLQIGTAPASTLGERTGIQRSTAQYTCQQLTKKGLVRMVQKGNTYLYTPEPPEKLLLLLNKEEEEIREKGQAVNRILGTLKNMLNPHLILPKVQFFEGRKGIIDLYEKILTLKGSMDTIEDRGEMFQFFPDYVTTFVERRIKNGIFNRVICPSNNPINRSDPEKLRDMRTLSPEEFPFTCSIIIREDHVCIFSFEQNTAVGIDILHTDIAKNFHILFNTLWLLLEQRKASPSPGEA